MLGFIHLQATMVTRCKRPSGKEISRPCFKIAEKERAISSICDVFGSDSGSDDVFEGFHPSDNEDPGKEPNRLRLSDIEVSDIDFSDIRSNDNDSEDEDENEVEDANYDKCVRLVN